MASPVPTPTQQRRLDSWKQIASYLNKSVKTVQRWEQTEGLPVHKHVHLQRSSVFAFAEELDQWLERRRQSPAPLLDAPSPRVSKRTILWTAAGAGVLASLLTWASLPRTEAPAQFRSTPFTTLPGEEYYAAISPDHKTVAFFWQHPDKDKVGIYRRPLDSKSEDVTALRVNPNEVNSSPAWSPDGRWIAYVRSSEAGAWLRVMAPDGTADRAVHRLGEPRTYLPHVLNLSWGPDSRWLMARTQPSERVIKRISLEGEAAVVARAEGSIYSPSVAPDGRSMIFQRRQGVSREGASEVMLQKLDGEGFPNGEPTVIYHTWAGTRGLAWSPGGKDIVMCAQLPGAGWRLFRVAIDGSSEKRAVQQMSDKDCTTVTISAPSPSGSAVLLHGTSSNERFTKLWQTSLDRLGEATEFAPSTRASLYPRFSPDGLWLAFVSERSGQPEVWRADADGSHVVRLTTEANAFSPAEWSPEGKRLIFASGASTSRRLAIVPAEGGPITTIPLGGQQADKARWSQQPDTVYYSSSTQMWQARINGSGRRLLYDGATNFLAAESLDGRYIHFSTTPDYDLLRVPTAGGTVERIGEAFADGQSSATPRSLYFLRVSDRALCRIPRAGGATECLGVIPALSKSGILRLTLFGFTVSPDEKRIVWAAQDPQIDLEMIREFR
jgi:Tol biopolymer transport system component